MAPLRTILISMGFIGVSWAGGVQSKSPVREEQPPEAVARRPIWGTGLFDHLLNRNPEDSSPTDSEYGSFRPLDRQAFPGMWLDFDSGRVEGVGSHTGVGDDLETSTLNHHTTASPLSTIEDTTASLQQVQIGRPINELGLDIWKQSYPPVSSADPLLFAVRAGYVARHGWVLWVLNERAFQEWHQVRPAHRLLEDVTQALGQPGRLKRKAYRTLRTRIRGYLQANCWNGDLLLQSQDAEKLRCLWLLLGRKRGEALIAHLEAPDF